MLKQLFLLFAFFSLLGIVGISIWYFRSSPRPSITSPLTDQKAKPTPLDEYTFDNLATHTISPSPIEIIGIIDKQPQFTAYQFTFISEGKHITGQINLPQDYADTITPVVIMLRGFIDPEIYQTGVGTQNAAAVFARNGFITLAPDFAGYGDSDPADINTYAARLQKPVTVITLIESVKTLDYIDPHNIFLWGHSNGGQIALSVLEITGQPYPTTLWAPVSKPFPYNILYYTDEFDDHGKALRKSLAEFEQDYDTDLFSIHSYFDQITAPIQIHQGGQDDAVPLQWSDELAQTLTDLTDDQDQPLLDVTYYTYPNADHNLQPNWNTVVSRDLSFFRLHLTSPTP